jgi:hypothetical protein
MSHLRRTTSTKVGDSTWMRAIIKNHDTNRRSLAALEAGKLAELRSGSEQRNDNKFIKHFPRRVPNEKIMAESGGEGGKKRKIMHFRCERGLQGEKLMKKCMIAT